MSNTSQLIWTNYGYKRRTTTTPFRASHAFQEASPEVLSRQKQKCERASGSMSTPGILTQMGTPWRLLHSAGHNKSSCRFKLWDGEPTTTSFSARSCSHRTKNIVAKKIFLKRKEKRRNIKLHYCSLPPNCATRAVSEVPSLSFNRLLSSTQVDCRWFGLCQKLNPSSASR